MTEFQAVATRQEISDPGTLLVEIDERLIVLACIQGNYYALDDVCTHDGGPLSEGTLAAEPPSLACPRHGARFHLATGAALSMPATQATGAHEVRLEGDQILVRLGDPSSGESTDRPATGSTAAPQAAEPTSSVPPATSAPPQEPTSPAAATGPLSESHVLESLKQVIDPELFVNIVDLGLIYGVQIRPSEKGEDQSQISVEMTMTSPACPAGPQLMANSKDCLSRLEGVDDVEIKLVMDPPWTPDRMTEAAKDQLGIF